MSENTNNILDTLIAGLEEVLRDFRLLRRSSVNSGEKQRSIRRSLDKVDRLSREAKQKFGEDPWDEDFPYHKFGW
jgi:hypothetical protein